jgi:hypothetical protein
VAVDEAPSVEVGKTGAGSMTGADEIDVAEIARPQTLQKRCELSYGCPQPTQNKVPGAAGEVGGDAIDPAAVLEPHLTQNRAIAGRSHPQTGQYIP